MNVTDPWAQKWFDTKDGKNWLSANDFPIPPVYAPQRECTKNDPRPELVLSVNEGDPSFHKIYSPSTVPPMQPQTFNHGS